jgi:queuine tRNA-ribosyltransferase
MPVGTCGSVKTTTPEELKQLGAQIILGNTYHLHLRPGEEIVKHFGGLPKFSAWNGPMLTDSGGFQVFSLAKIRQIDDEGVTFRSHLDGSEHRFTPESVMKIQRLLGADIVMPLDECAPADADYSLAKQALERTHRWLRQCQKSIRNSKTQALFPIIQGALFKDLRIESVKFCAEGNLHGIAIGGLAVGETRPKRLEILDILEPHLPKNIPRYLMGVGEPVDLIEAVARGCDMFDCVLPTRLGRHGSFFTPTGRQNIANEKFKRDKKPLVVGCACPACRDFSRGYLRHLYLSSEITALRLLTLHNLHFILELMREMRESILNGKFENWRKRWLSREKCEGRRSKGEVEKILISDLR